PGFGCSDLVRQSKLHHTKISGHGHQTRSNRRPCQSAGKCNRETRKIHEKKSTPSVEGARESTKGNEGNEDESRLFVSFCSKPPGTYAEPGDGLIHNLVARGPITAQRPKRPQPVPIARVRIGETVDRLLSYNFSTIT